MTRLALCALVWSPCTVLVAQEPKKPSEFEGAWQEPTRPGEDPSMRYKITFAGEKVTIHYREQVLTGTFAATSKSDPVTITMTITEVKGDGEHTKGTYRALYQIEKTRVSLHFNPAPAARWQVIPRSEREPPPKIEIIGPDGQKKQVFQLTPLSRSPGMDLAPVTLTLHKVVK